MPVAPWSPSNTLRVEASAVFESWSNVVESWSNQEIVEEHDGHWTVRNPETGIFGSGPDRDAAVEDFERALREHLDVLGRQAELSDDLTAQLVYLRQRLS
jgi:hypothetical protein